MPELQLRGGEVDGLRLPYVVEGRGPAVIFVHGLGGFDECWRHNVRPLAGRATVFAVDLPGFGDSAKPRTSYRLGYFANALRGFMDALGLAQASLVGHSLGGAVSITLALTHPSRVERLALVGAIVPGGCYRPSWIYRLVALRGLGEMLSRGGNARRSTAGCSVLWSAARRPASGATEMDEISPQDLKTRLAGSDRPLLLDVRQDWETRLCRLENAVHIPIEEIELRVDELNADDEIVVYCHQGVRSAAVADYLRQRGFKNVKNLHGGLDYWARTVDPSMRRY